MSFAQEMRDFTSAFTAVSNVMGTVSSREGDRLNNELRQANIDYTRARTAEIGGAGLDFGTYVAGLGGYTGAPLDRSVDPGGSGTSAATGALEIGAGAPNTGGAGVFFTGDTPGMPNPRPRPTAPAASATASSVPLPKTRPTRPATTAAVGDEDISLPNTEAVATTGSAADTAIRAAGVRPYEVKIGDHTSWSGMQPKALQIANTMGETARQMGIRLVATAGAGGGHRSHSMGSESDWMGYHADGSEWTRAERAQIAAAGGSVGANRFGLYPGGSLHVGYSGPDRPSAVWGAHGILNGGSARDFGDPADRAFLSLFQSGKLYGAGGGTFAQAFATTGASPLARARNAIAAIESRGSGDYGARNGNALGRYQVMASNLPQWSERALGRVVSPEEFLRNPAIQDRIFDTQFGSLLEKYGNVQDAASAWFTGRPLGGGGAGASDGNITGAEYVKRFNQAYGSADYSSGGGGGGADVVRGTPRDDTLVDMPVEKPADSSGGSTADTGTGPEDYRGTTRSAVPAGTPQDIIHTVVSGDNLTKLAKKYNLDSYQIIYDANKDVIGSDPNELTPGMKLRIPGVADPAASIPDPQPRPTGAVPAEDTYQTPTVQSDLTPEQMVKVDQLRAQQALDAGPHLRPAVGDEPAVAPTTSTSTRTVRSDLTPAQMAEVKRRVAEQASMPPNPRPRPEHMPDAEIAAITSPTIGYMGTPETQMSIDRTGAVPITPTVRSDLTPEQLDRVRQREGIGPFPPRPDVSGEALAPGAAEEPISGTDMSGVGAVDALDRAGGRADTMTPAEASIAEASAAYNVTSYGNMVHPNGRVGADSSFTSGRKAAIAGSGWLARMLGLDKAGAVDDAEAAAPDDGAPTAASAKLSGKFAMSHSEVAQADAVIDAWAAKNGIVLTESERNVRALGLVFDYWLSRGEPEKAQALAAARLQYHQVLYNQYSAIGKAAVEAGDTEKGVEAAVKAYAQIPDGRDITVTGDAVSGWKVRYTDEETGKVINEKVLSPQEMEGMIMHMAPGDVDKFLVKAAGQDALPEASPQLVKMLADLDATPDGVRPTFDARGAASLDSTENQILHTAYLDQMSQYDEATGGAAARVEAGKEATDASVLFPGAGGTPPATPAATATPAAEGAGATPVPTTPITPIVPTTAPTTSTPATPGMGGGVGDDALSGSGATSAEGELKPGEVAPGIFEPGDDQTFGLGPPPQENLKEAWDLQSNKGLTVHGAQAAQALDAYKRELELRLSRWQAWRMEPGHIPPRQHGPTNLQGGGVDEGDNQGKDVIFGNAGALAKTQQQFPYLDPRVIQSPLPPGPNDGLGGYGMEAKPTVDPRKKYLQSDANVKLLEDQNVIDVANWQTEHDRREQKYKDAAKILDPPLTRKLSDEDRTSAPGIVDKHITALQSDMTEDEINHFRSNESMVTAAAQVVAANNGLDLDTATDAVLAMIHADELQPSLPPWRAFAHPANPGVMLVQPLGPAGDDPNAKNDTPSGQILHIPISMFDPIARAWHTDSDRLIKGAEQTRVDGALPHVPSVAERILPALGQGAEKLINTVTGDGSFPGTFDPSFDPSVPMGELSDLFDWYTHGVFKSEPAVPDERQTQIRENRNARYPIPTGR